METITYFQQGDTLEFVEAFPNNTKKVVSNVVAEGEMTGHAHRLEGANFTMYEEPKAKTRHLRVVEPTDLSHEEHKALTIPPEDYRISGVMEFDHYQEQLRKALD